ncbi:hypothetical protein H8E77_27055 [bacterium]|nr:hypothetical protein [bacterium]
MKGIIVGLTLMLLVASAWAGTFRDNFTNEKDFLEDMANGVWLGGGSYTWENGALRSRLPGDLSNLLITGDVDWEDYAVECRAKITRLPGVVGLVLRAPGPVGKCYIFGLEESAAFLWADYIPVAEEPFERKRNTWYTLKAVAEGNRLKFYVDGRLMIQKEDNTHPKGCVAIILMPYGKPTEALFDDFMMTGSQVPNGGHPAFAVEPQNKLATTWATVKKRR